jgi:hypothetical protein
MWWFTVQLGKQHLTNPIRDRDAVDAAVAYQLARDDAAWRIVEDTPNKVVLVNGTKRSERIAYYVLEDETV